LPHLSQRLPSGADHAQEHRINRMLSALRLCCLRRFRAGACAGQGSGEGCRWRRCCTGANNALTAAWPYVPVAQLDRASVS
jgi:hypothetical protein